MVLKKIYFIDIYVAKIANFIESYNIKKNILSILLKIKQIIKLFKTLEIKK